MKFTKGMTNLIRKPFVNLTPRAKFVFALRFFSSLFLIISLSSLISWNFGGDTMYIAKIDCNREDLATGLFTTIHASFKTADSMITTSEINLLAQYTENKIKNTPEVIYSHMQYSCYKKYDAKKVFSFKGYDYNFDSLDDGTNQDTSTSSNDTITCGKPKSDYVFDYRDELSKIGLNVILAYAYNADFVLGDRQSGFSNDVVYKPDNDYVKTTIERRKQNTLCVVCLKIALAFSVLITLVTVVYYGLRTENEMDDSEYPLLWKHIIGALSLILFITVFMASISTLIIVLHMQQSIEIELATFGIKMKLGTWWFGILWLSLWLSFASFLVWGGTVWCNRTVNKSVIKEQLSNERVVPSDDIKFGTTPFNAMDKYYNDDRTTGSESEHFWNDDSNPFESSVEEIPLENLSNSDPIDGCIITKSPIIVKSFFSSSSKQISPLKNHGDRT